MASLVFWDVDTQFDFMRAEGKLYVPGAERIVPRLRALTSYARTHGIVRVASVDDHVLADPEISPNPDFLTTFPPHCLRGTRGQRKIAATAMRDPAVVPNTRKALAANALRRLVGERTAILVQKSCFDVFTNPNTTRLLDLLAPRTIVVYGVATDVCNAYAIEGFLARGGIDVALVADAARPIHARRGRELVADWRSRGVAIVRTADVLRGAVR